MDKISKGFFLCQVPSFILKNQENLFFFTLFISFFTEEFQIWWFENNLIPWIRKKEKINFIWRKEAANYSRIRLFKKRLFRSRDSKEPLWVEIKHNNFPSTARNTFLEIKEVQSKNQTLYWRDFQWKSCLFKINSLWDWYGNESKLSFFLFQCVVWKSRLIHHKFMFSPFIVSEPFILKKKLKNPLNNEKLLKLRYTKRKMEIMKLNH